jgi:hypothetical protein
VCPIAHAFGVTSPYWDGWSTILSELSDDMWALKLSVASFSELKALGTSMPWLPREATTRCQLVWFTFAIQTSIPRASRSRWAATNAVVAVESTNLAHYRIDGHPVSIIDILITRKAAENRLT